MQRLVLYVRSTGSDTTGDGTFAKPFLTPDRALDAADLFLRWTRVVIDMTGYGTWSPTTSNYSVFPGKLQLRSQPWGSVVAGIDFATFSDEADLTFQAVPTPYDTNVSGYTQAHDAVTGLVTITVPGKSWTVNALVKKLWCGTSGVNECGVIVANTANTVTIAADHAYFTSTGAGVGVYDYSATWLTPSGNPQIVLQGHASVQFNGFKIKKSAQDYHNVVLISQIPFARFVCCDIDGISFWSQTGAQPGFASMPHVQGCRISSDNGYTTVNGLDLSASAIIENTFLDTCAVMRENGGIAGRSFLAGIYASACQPLGHTAMGTEYGEPQSLDQSVISLEGIDIENPVSHAIQVFGGIAHIANVRVGGTVNAGCDCIHADGPSKIMIVVRGGNGAGGGPGGAGPAATMSSTSLGVRLLNGAHVISDGTAANFTGQCVGGDLKVGQRITRTWADFVSATPANGPQYLEADMNDFSIMQWDAAAFSFSGKGLLLDYLAATAGNWANSPPTNIKSAIDRLAAAIFALRGNSPIP